MFRRPLSLLKTELTMQKPWFNGKEVDVAVETGISDDTNTVVTSGLTEGEK